MGRFHETLIEENRALMERIWDHPIVTAIGSGSPPKDTLTSWTCQTYHLARSFEQVLARFAASAPDDFRKSVMDCLYVIHGEMEAFEEATSGTDRCLRSSKMSYETTAAASYLLATAHTRPIGETATAIFSAEYAFLHAWWKLGRDGQNDVSDTDLVSLLSERSRSDWLDCLADFVDQSAEAAGGAETQAMRETFPLPLHYQLKWWDSFLGTGKE